MDMQLTVSEPEPMSPAVKTPIPLSLLVWAGGAECGFAIVALALYSTGAVVGDQHRAAAAAYMLALGVGLLALMVGSALVAARTSSRKGTVADRLWYLGFGLFVGAVLGSALALPEAMLYLPAFLVASAFIVGLAIKVAKS